LNSFFCVGLRRSVRMLTDVLASTSQLSFLRFGSAS
jgi:hypothetical protein